jgi:hypothetical protein
MSEVCRKCSNPALAGKHLCAYHKAERDEKRTRILRNVVEVGKEVGPYLLAIGTWIFSKGKSKRK